MKFWRWDEGRQLSGYSKMLIAASRLLKFDCYLIKIPTGAAVPEHKDPATEGYEHHRFNYVLKAPAYGSGKFHIHGPAKRVGQRGVLFRPDLYAHSLSPVDFIWSNQSMYILSIGWLRKAKHATHG